ncbi:Imm50 family immunity protein [Kitasatospora sp. NPDC049285]|uniref:Imm50 family immunity protein n=1 Tax=Kitasatospora sp. NPDC049285 TaxID=3157096 RepID=UPI0034200211
MNGSDWTSLLRNGDVLRGLFDPVPALESLDLFSLLVDEREHGLTLGFESPGLPAQAPRPWVEQGLNTVEFHLVFTGLRHLDITGWSSTGMTGYRFEPEAHGGLHLLMTGPDALVRLSADSCRVEGVRAYRAGGV